MTLREFGEALAGLPQLPDDTEIVVEDDNGDLWSINYVESEPERGVVVLRLFARET